MSSQLQPGSEWIVGGGEMGQLIRSMDWSSTPLGSIASWPQNLRTTVNLCLASDLPICLIWGAELVQLYNDGYRVICGGKHPRSMGQNFPECWREAWPVIGEAHDSALAGQTAFLENQQIFLERHGYVEECFFTFSFSPIRDENGQQAGLFHPVIEMTPKMLGERRTRTLRDLASRTSRAKSMEEAFALSTATLAEYPLDLPFLLIYRLDKTEPQARLVAATGLAAGAKGAPDIVALNAPTTVSWPLAEVLRADAVVFVDDVAARFGNFSAGPFPESVASAVLLPITPPGAERPVAIVIAGINPRLKSNEMYGAFHVLLSGSITTAVANARAYEEERKRAEALAEIDRAKTMFFSNVSHEFRTPLTLMLGPTEELLALAPGALPPDARTQLEVVHRNSLRLQKMVNSLLDFSRLEAGRIQASYEPVDLAALTGDLASVFRSAIEKAGLKFTVDCPPLPEPMYVDHDMWEKIVLNLISNAFKFTLAGEIEVSLRAVAADDEGRAGRSAPAGSGATSGALDDNAARRARSDAPYQSTVVLTVRDTGTGIATAELPRIFERFHRVAGAASRTHEGTGIGLSLVQELVKLHGGTVSLESVFGKGSVFTVTIPKGTAHLPQDRLGAGRTLPSTAVGAVPFLEEAARWLPEKTPLTPALSPSEGARENRSPAVDETRASRKFEKTGAKLSASASPHAESVAPSPPSEGGEGRGEAGSRILVVDDNADMREYVRRLLAPHFHVETAPDGQAALELIEHHLPDLVIADVMMPRLDGFGLVQRLRADAHTSALPIIVLSARAGEEAHVEGLEAGADDYLIKPFSARELLARVESQLKLAAMRREAREQLREINAQLEQRVDELQKARRVAQKSEEALRDAEAQVQAALLAGAVGTWNFDLPTDFITANPSLLRIFGLNSADGGLSPEAFFAAIVPEDQAKVREAIARALASASNGVYETDFRVGTPEGKVKWVFARGQVEYDDTGKPLRLPGALTDITERKQAEEALRQSEEHYRALITTTSDVVYRMSADWSEMCRLDGRGFITDTEKPSRTWLHEYIHPDDQPRVLAAIGKAIGSKSAFELDHRVQRVDGSLGWAFSRAIPLLDAQGEIVEWFGAASDVTERKEVEEALRESEERFHQMADNIAPLAWMADEQGWLFWYNRRWYEYTGTTYEEMQGWGWEKVHEPGELQRMLPGWKHSLATGEPWEDIFPLRRHDGQYRWFLSRAFPIRNAEGKITRWFGTNSDITELREAQELLGSRAKQLEKFVAERTVKLQETVSELESFSYSITHDLRAPMRAMQGFSHILADQYGDRLDATGKDYLSRINTSALRMDKLISDVLVYSRVLRADLKLEPVDMNRLLRGILETYLNLQEPGAEVRVEGVLPPALGNAAALTQCFSNLLGNAVKFVAPGTKPRVRVSAQPNGRMVRYYIEDNGIGIDPKYVSTIFKMFQRLSNEYEGTGIGLTIVRKAAERMGGSIGVETKTGSGSRFWLELAPAPPTKDL